MSDPYRSPAKSVSLNPITINVDWIEWNEHQVKHARMLAVLRAIANMTNNNTSAVQVARDLLIDMGIDLP